MSPADPRASFEPSARTLPVMLQRQAARYGDRALFVCDGARWSYAQTADIAARSGGRFAAAGIGKGDRVAILCGNRPEFLDLFLGLGWIGAVSVPLNVAARGPQLEHMLKTSGARLLVLERAWLPALEFVDFVTLNVEAIWVIDPDGDTRDRHQNVPIAGLPALAESVPAADLKPHDLLTILFTSGTTGPSKGVCCPHAQFFWWGFFVLRQLALHDGDILHTTLPLFHVNAMATFFQALLNGCTQVVEKRFSASNFWPALVASGATVTYVLGAMVPMLLSRPPCPEERQHKVRVALAPGVPAHLHELFTERTGIYLLDAYGATESNATIGTTIETRRPGWMGKLFDGFQARVADEDDNEVPDGTPGELLLRADEPFAMATGYIGMPDKTVEAWRNLWLHTGDRVVRDADGYYKFIDRMKDSIRRRGENISSFEVEKVIMSHPAVEVAAVFPVPSDLAEDEVMATVVVKEGAALDGAELIRFCEGRLSYFAIPRFVDFVSELPRTESGKVQKFKLREQGRSAATWDREAAGIKLKR
ncbi:ATP-dependent acyl-CoA ligase [Pseudorhodoplanes sp.]|uniref:ATP-dependent acyl-CoA ligase n=1 Tax=Pseudorhodoplanes sp. TaxID=1934341 RepID=UPI00391D05C6